MEMANKIKYRKTVKAIMESVQVTDSDEQAANGQQNG
jgi:hypothetical protein